MPENLPDKNVKDDEIDLLDLFSRIGRSLSRLIKAIGRAFIIALVFLLKKWLPLSLSLFLGIGASYLLKTITSPLYTSDIVLRNNAILNSDMISYINRLHIFCKEKNYQALSSAISTPLQEVINIKDICAFYIIDQGNDEIPDFVDYQNIHDVYDTFNIRMDDRLDIRVKTRSPNDLFIIQEGIIKFINADSLFQQLNRIRLRQNRELLARLDYDILQLDSLQKVKYFEETRNMQPQNGGQMIFLQEQKTQLVYYDIYSLYERKQLIESEQEFYKDLVTVISGFYFPIKRINGTSYHLKYVIPSFFILTLLILIIITNRKRLKEIYKKYE